MLPLSCWRSTAAFQRWLRHDAHCRVCGVLRYDFSASRGYHEDDQCVLFRGCDTGVCLARRGGFEAWHHPRRFHVSRCAVGRTNNPAPEHSLAEAHLHCRSAWPGIETAIAPAFKGKSVRAGMLVRPLQGADIGCVPGVVVFDLEKEEIMNCFQRVDICCLNANPAAGRHLVMDKHGNGEFPVREHYGNVRQMWTGSPACFGCLCCHWRSLQ